MLEICLPQLQSNLATIRQSHRPILLLFWAKWNAPSMQFCEQLVAALEDILPHLDGYHVNVDTAPWFLLRYKLRAVPCALLLRNERVWRRITTLEEMPKLYQELRACVAR